MPDAASPPDHLVLRNHRPGDLGWIVSRHGALYAIEYALDSRFEAMVARIAADFLERFDSKREACWIAERAGQALGSVVLVQARHDDTQLPVEGMAQLRLLLVEPTARGLGLGKLLTSQCERFAREAGYRKIILWTQGELLAARGIYAKAGYVLTGTETHRAFGREQVAETWELVL